VPPISFFPTRHHHHLQNASNHQKFTFLRTLSMTPTLGPTPPLPTPPLSAFATYHTTSSASLVALPEPNVEEVITEEGVRHADNVVLDAR
jgi:hypothetical protein